MSEARAPEQRAWPNGTQAAGPALAASGMAQATPTSQSQVAASAAAAVAPARHGASLQATAAATAASKTRPQLKVSTSQSTVPMHTTNNSGQRRVWFRRAGSTATSLVVDMDDLVDDLKVKILAKYPTSLLLVCDPADLLVSIPGDVVKARATAAASPALRKMPISRPRGSSLSKGNYKSPLVSPQVPQPLELQPDEPIVAVIDRFYPDGMAMGDALEVSTRAAVPAPQQTLGVAAAPAAALAAAASLSRQASSARSRSQAPTPAAAAAATPAATPASAKPRLVVSPSSTQLVRRAVPAAAVEKKPSEGGASGGGGGGGGGGVLLLPRQLKLSASDKPGSDRRGSLAIGSVTSLSSGTELTPPLPADHEGLLEMRQLYNKLPASQPSVVVPQVSVLIVEDNEINQKILETALRRNKVRCSIAKNGRDAVAKWRGGGFHIILMDLQLPVMSGLEASKEIRRLETVNRIGAFSDAKSPGEVTDDDKIEHTMFKSPVIIVALTASSSAEDRAEALRAGCNDFLTKPVNLDWLQQKLLEWGCMQALIDFEGWNSWYVPESGPPKPSNSLFRRAGPAAPQLASQAAAQTAAQTAAAPGTPGTPGPLAVPRPQSPRPVLGRQGRVLDRFAARSRSNSSRRSPA